MPGYTQDGLRHAASISGVLQPIRYIFAVGPPKSEIVPVKPLTLSRICSTSRIMESSERLWIIRPSCSVMLQKVQPPKQPRMILTEVLIMSHAGILASPYTGCGARAYGRSNTKSISSVVSGMGGGVIHTSRAVVPSPWACTSARALPGLVSKCSTRLAWAYSTGSDLTAS